MQKTKIKTLSRCNKRTGHYSPAKNPVSCTAYRAEYANLGIFDAVESNGTAFAPKQTLNQSVAVGMENPKIKLISRCNKRTGRYGPAKNPVSCTAYRAEYTNLGIFDAVESNGTAFAPKQCFYQKVAVGMENPKIQSLSRCNKRTGPYGPENNQLLCTAYRAEYAKLGIFDGIEINGTAFAPKQSLH